MHRKVIALSLLVLGGCTFLSGFATPLECGDGIFTPEREECDDGNADSGDGCDSECQEEICGDGTIQPGEDCDDSNTTNNDGCSLLCVFEDINQTVVVSSINIPDNDAEAATFAEDVNQDGVINDSDNTLADVKVAFASAGLDIESFLTPLVQEGRFSYGFDIFTDGTTASLEGYKPLFNGGNLIPSFTGGDTVTPLSGVTSFDVELINGSLHAVSPAPFFFISLSSILAEFFATSELPLHNAVINMTLSGGSLSGTLDRFEVAEDMERAALLINNLIQVKASEFNGGAAPQTCGFGAACIDLDGADSGACTDQNDDGISTGVCIPDPVLLDVRVFSLLDAFDFDRDGTVEIQFDAGSQSFSVNDGAAIFDLDPATKTPQGLLGSLFLLDFDNDGINESLGIGVGFTTANAIRQ